jgi:plastocyanin
VGNSGKGFILTLVMCLTWPHLCFAMPDHAMHHPEKDQEHEHAMVYNESGMIMNHNEHNLPLDCHEISRDYAFTIRAGVDYASDFPGTIFGMDQHEVIVDPCSRIKITFVNEDQVRHQWMLHGLPKYLYDQGMFTLEAMGGKTQSGSFIVPGDNRTYLVHCDLPQHMEKGMKGQLVVGSGSGDLWSIPGISSEFRKQDYLPHGAVFFFLLAIISGIIVSAGSFMLFGKSKSKL